MYKIYQNAILDYAMTLFIKNKKDYAMNLDQKTEDYAMNNINEFVPLKISKNILIYIYIFTY